MADKATAKIVIGRGNGKGQQCLENLAKCAMARKDAEFIIIDEFFRLQNEKRFFLKCRKNEND